MGGGEADIVCMGEPLFEFAWRRDGTIKPGIGGDVSNCAVAAARSGAKAGMITRLGEDSLGERIRSLYHDEGIATTHVIRDAAAPTGIYFIEYGPDGHSFSYRRAGSAASRLASSDLAPGMFAGVSFLHLSGISQAISESCRDASFTAMEMARSAGAKVSFDTNLRRSLWTPAAAWETLSASLPQIDFLFPSMEDAQALLGLSDPDAICDEFLRHGVKTVLLTLGEEGAIVAGGDMRIRIPAYSAQLVDATAAGDTFDGAFLAEFLRCGDPEAATRFACAAASLAVEKTGAVDSIPYLREIRTRMAA